MFFIFISWMRISAEADDIGMEGHVALLLFRGSFFRFFFSFRLFVEGAYHTCLLLCSPFSAALHGN